MVDAELIRHQETWQGFTTFVKWGIGGVTLLLILMWTFLL